MQRSFDQLGRGDESVLRVASQNSDGRHGVAAYALDPQNAELSRMTIVVPDPPRESETRALGGGQALTWLC